MNNIPNWQDIMSRVNTLEPCLNAEHKGLKFKGLGLPVSISEVEFKFITEWGRKYKRKSALDMYTGTGLSALALGLAVLPQKGNVLSIDSYYEESAQAMPVGQEIHVNPNYMKTLGFQTATDLAQAYGLFATVGYCCGMWPQDSEKLLSEFVEKSGPIDFVMLDGPKGDKIVKEAFESLVPYMAPQYSIFIHDYLSDLPETEEYLLTKWNQKPYNCREGLQHYPLMLVHKE